MNPGSFRKVMRYGHLLASAILGTYLYSPWSSDPVFSFVTLYIVFPAMAISGIAMWQQPKLLKALKRGNAV